MNRSEAEIASRQAASRANEERQFYTPQQISDTLSAIAMLDSQEPKTGTKKRLDSMMDFDCGSGAPCYSTCARR